MKVHILTRLDMWDVGTEVEIEVMEYYRSRHHNFGSWTKES